MAAIEWLGGTLEEIGEVEPADHHAKVDTDDVHYDTFDYGDASDPDRPTCAIEVHWV